MEEKLTAVVSSYPDVYNLSSHVYRDVTKKNTACEEVAEIVGVSGECT